MKKKLYPVHPGEVLLEEFLRPMGISQNKLALNMVCQHGESTRSFSASVELPLIPLSDLQLFLEHQLNSGSGCSHSMT